MTIKKERITVGEAVSITLEPVGTLLDWKLGSMFVMANGTLGRLSKFSLSNDGKKMYGIITGLDDNTERCMNLDGTREPGRDADFALLGCLNGSPRTEQLSFFVMSDIKVDDIIVTADGCIGVIRYIGSGDYPYSVFLYRSKNGGQMSESDTYDNFGCCRSGQLTCGKNIVGLKPKVDC